VSGGFVAHRGDRDLHDGVVDSVDRSDEQVVVVVRAQDGRVLVVEFSGVESLDQHRAVGMTLYALSEFEQAGEHRLFVFTNWDDEDDARLELLARDFTCVERSF
jgi:hypothetical protein